MSGFIAYALMAANPIGGLLIAIPFAMLSQGFSAWLVVATGVPFAYLQVLVIDLGWSRLERLAFTQRLLARVRGKWADRLVQSRGAFWVTFVATPMMGPWAVMALMRVVGVPQRRIALALVSSMTTLAVTLAALCTFVPAVFE
jgi:hypothetical protein